MPSNEKEINCNLFDQLAILDRLELIAIETKDTKILDAIAFERKLIERKLYQQPPLAKGDY